MRGNGTRRDPAAGLPDAALWRRSRTVDMPDDEAEAERYLDLAGFADGRLDPDDRERVAEFLAGNPVAAGDVAAAHAPAGRQVAVPESAIARACALVEPRGAMVVPFPHSRRDRPRLQGMAPPACAGPVGSGGALSADGGGTQPRAPAARRLRCLCRGDAGPHREDA